MPKKKKKPDRNGGREKGEVSKYLENIYSSIEEIDNLVARLICIAVASRREGVDACSVFIPFVLPERLCGPGIRQPVGVHVLQKRRLPCSRKDLADVVVSWRGSAVSWVGAIAEVGPIGFFHLICQ